jgi:hypothetical protein
VLSLLDTLKNRVPVGTLAVGRRDVGVCEGVCALHNAERSGSPALCAWAPTSKLTIGAYRLERYSNSKSVIDRPSAIKLKRTETTHDLSQKAENG